MIRKVKSLFHYFIYLSLIGLCSNNIKAQNNSIHLQELPQPIIRSWHPEYKILPSLKIGEKKIIFITIPEFNNLSIKYNDIDLKTNHENIEIWETGKPNQYLITVNNTNTQKVDFELWFDLDEKDIYYSHNEVLTNLKSIYPLKENRILIDTVSLDLIH